MKFITVKSGGKYDKDPHRNYVKINGKVYEFFRTNDGGINPTREVTLKAVKEHEVCYTDPDDKRFTALFDVVDDYIYFNGLLIGIVVAGRQCRWYDNTTNDGKRYRKNLLLSHSTECLAESQTTAEGRLLVPLYFRGQFGGLNVYEDGDLVESAFWACLHTKEAESSVAKNIKKRLGWKDKKK